MPVHKIPAASIHEDCIDLERQGERIRSVDRISKHYFLVLTDYPRLQETRPNLRELTHAARVGAQEQRAQWDRDPLLHSFLTDGIVRDGGDA